MKILHLTLHKKWFDLIALGQKTEEYRAVTPYWMNRLSGKSFDEIHFRNGYHPNNPSMRVECLGIESRNDVYVLKLGKILELKP